MSSPYGRESYVMYRSRSRPRSRSYSPPARSIRSAQSRSRSPPNNTSRVPPSPHAPSTARAPRHQNDRKRRSRNYANPVDGSPSRRRHEVTMLLCVFSSTTHNWKTYPIRFRPDKVNDRELWQDIRDCFRTDLQKPWKRWFGFKKVKSIVPIAYSPNGVPCRTDPKDFPAARNLVHAYHHPDLIKPNHLWVDYLVSFDAGDKRQNGLEFVEGLWAEKLAVVAITASVAIIVVSIVWCALGGQLQTVFTVMGFVLTFVAAEIALIALYYQIISGNSPSS